MYFSIKYQFNFEYQSITNKCFRQISKMKRLIFSTLLILANLKIYHAATVSYHCVRLESYTEDEETGLLLLDFTPIACGNGSMDLTSIQTGYKITNMDKAILNEKDKKMDSRFYQVGTELMMVNSGITKRGIMFAPFFGILGAGTAVVATAIGIVVHGYYTADDRPVPKYVRHEDSNKSDYNYLEQLRRQELKDAQYKLDLAMRKAKYLDPTQVMPAKRSGKKGEWCTAVVQKSVSLSNNNNVASTSNAASAPGSSGNGPTPPPNRQWTKGTPASKVGTEAPKKRKNNQPFIRVPKVIRLSDSPIRRPSIISDLEVSTEVEVFDISDDEIDVVIDESRSEVFLNAQPGSSITTQRKVCENANPTGVAQLDHFTSTNIVYTISDSSSEGTIDAFSSSSGSPDPNASPNSRGVPGVSPYTSVISSLPDLRVYPDPIYDRDLIQVTPAYGVNAWDGLGWGSTRSDYSNTCTLDSFLSHITYLHRHDPNYFNTVLRLVDSDGERAIRKILRISHNRGYTKQMKDKLIHEAWALAFPKVFTKASTGSNDEGRVDCLGNEFNNIVAPMQDSSQLWIAHTCMCQGLDYLFQPMITHQGPMHARWSADSIRWFENPNLAYPRAERTTLEELDCRSCTSNYNAIRGFVSESTWFHSFRVINGNQDPSVFDPNSYPRLLQFEELVTGNIVTFELGYISLVTRYYYDPVAKRMMPRVGHQTSIHWVEGLGWRFFDGFNGGITTGVPRDLHKRFEVASINYFRRI